MLMITLKTSCYNSRKVFFIMHYAYIFIYTIIFRERFNDLHKKCHSHPGVKNSSHFVPNFLVYSENLASQEFLNALQIGTGVHLKYFIKKKL
jgi:hypothetical protein